MPIKLVPPSDIFNRLKFSFYPVYRLHTVYFKGEIIRGQLILATRMQELSKIEIQDSSGGKFYNLLTSILTARIVKN